MRTNGLELVPVNNGNNNNRGSYGEMQGQMQGYGNNSMSGGFGGNPMGGYGGSGMSGYGGSSMSNFGPPSMMSSYGGNSMQSYPMYSNNSPMGDSSYSNWSGMFPAACLGPPPSYNNGYSSPISMQRSMSGPMMQGPMNGSMMGGMMSDPMQMSGFMSSPLSGYSAWGGPATVKGQMVETHNGSLPLWPGTSYEPPNSSMPMQYSDFMGQAKNNQMMSYGPPPMMNMEMGDMGRFDGYSMERGRVPMSMMRGSGGGEPKGAIINTPTATLEKIGETRRFVDMPGNMEIIGKSVRMLPPPSVGGNFGANYGAKGMNMNMPPQQYMQMANY